VASEVSEWENREREVQLALLREEEERMGAEGLGGRPLLWSSAHVIFLAKPCVLVVLVTKVRYLIRVSRPQTIMCMEIVPSA